MLRRIDHHIGQLRLDSRTPQGFIRTDAFLARTGVQTYRQPDGTIRRELRLAEEVFAPEAMESASLAPLTLDHPPEFVTPENAKTYTVGIVGEQLRKEDEKFLAGTVVVMNADAIASVESGERTELSCGYSIDHLEEKPGEWNGEPYDVIQRGIRINHVALVSRGRAGPDVRLRFDAAESVHPEPRNDGSTKGSSTMPKNTTPRMPKTHDMRRKRTDSISFRETESLIRSALREHLGIDEDSESWVWITDLYDDHVIYESDDRLYSIGYRIDGSTVQFTTEATEVRRSYEPVAMGRNDAAENGMEKLNINGVEYEASGQVVQAVGALVQGYEAKLAEKDAQIAKLTEELNAAKESVAQAQTATEQASAQADAMKAQVEQLEQERNDARDPERFRQAVQARVALERQALAVCGNIEKLDEMDDLDVKRTVIAKVHPNIKLDGKNETYIDAAYDLAIEAHAKQASPVNRLRQTVNDAQQPGTVRADRADRYARYMEMANAPLAATKR